MNVCTSYVVQNAKIMNTFELTAALYIYSRLLWETFVLSESWKYVTLSESWQVYVVNKHGVKLVLRG